MAPGRGLMAEAIHQVDGPSVFPGDQVSDCYATSYTYVEYGFFFTYSKYNFKGLT